MKFYFKIGTSIPLTILILSCLSLFLEPALLSSRDFSVYYSVPRYLFALKNNWQSDKFYSVAYLSNLNNTIPLLLEI